MKQPIIEADREYRKKVLIIYVVLVCLGAVVIGWGIPWAERHLGQQAPERALTVIKATLVVIFLTVVAMGLYVFRLGRSVIENERFPPPNQKVIRDTKLIEGEKARARGRILVALSLLLISFGLFGAFYVPRVLDELIKPRDTLAESSSLIPFANTDGHS